MFCFDKNYAIPAAVAFYSLLENNEKEALGGGAEFRLYVVHNDIPLENQNKLHETIKPFNHFAKLEFIDGGGYFDEIWKKIQSKNHFSKEMFYKLSIATLFTDYDKIIISDVDVVFLGNIINDFLNFSTSEKFLLSAVHSTNPEEFSIPKHGWKSRYKQFKPTELEAIKHGIDAGYMIINLKQWKNEDISKKMLKFLEENANRLVLPEQDIINIICFGRIQKLSFQYCIEPDYDLEYGSQWERLKTTTYSHEETEYARCNPIQLHYHGSNKPWIDFKRHKANIWFQYLCKTAMLNVFLNQLECNILRYHQQKKFFSKMIKSIKNPQKIIKKIFD